MDCTAEPQCWINNLKTFITITDTGSYMHVIERTERHERLKEEAF
jgi:hypothetical protein